MAIIKPYQEKEGILIFDSVLDESLSTYDAHHLDVLEKAETYHFWFQNRCAKICCIFDDFVPKKSRILEIGGGTGFIAEKMLEQGYSIEMGEVHSNGLNYAKKKGIKKLYQFDLFHPPFEEEFDVICLFDVLEHLSDDQLALTCIKKMLKPAGMLILTVPAHSWLWSHEDVIAGHKRRYTKDHLETLFQRVGMESLHNRYFFSAILPFLFLRKLSKKNSTFEIKLNVFLNKFCDFLTQSEFYLDRLLPNVAGGSLLAVAQKN